MSAFETFWVKANILSLGNELLITQIIFWDYRYRSTRCIAKNLNKKQRTTAYEDELKTTSTH